MITIYYSKKGTPYVWASDLHKELEIKTSLRDWFPRMIEYGFIENQDFSQVLKNERLAKGGSTKQKEWFVQLDMAKHIAMMQRSEKGKAIREYLLHLDQKVSEGLLINESQMTALFDICKVMGFFSVQKFFELEHYNNIFGGDYNKWWESRAILFGYNVDDLKEIMRSLGARYKSQKQALMKIDKYELIRIGVMDMFLAMGKSKAFAKNVSNFSKKIAQEIKVDIYDDRKTSIDFKSDSQKLIITDLKSYKNNSSLLDQFIKGKQQIGKPNKTLKSLLAPPSDLKEKKV